MSQILATALHKSETMCRSPMGNVADYLIHPRLDGVLSAGVIVTVSCC